MNQEKVENAVGVQLGAAEYGNGNDYGKEYGKEYGRNKIFNENPSAQKIGINYLGWSQKLQKFRLWIF